MSSREEKAAVTENFADLTKNLNAKEIIDDMKSEKLLTDNEHTEIEGLLERSKLRDANSKLLKSLQKKKPTSLNVFIQILKKTEGSEYLGDQLEAGTVTACSVDLCSGSDHADRDILSSYQL